MCSTRRSMSKGFLWFAQNNDKTNYVEISIRLAESIKSWNKENQICVVTDEHSKFTHDAVDYVKILKKDSSENHKIKWANEYKAFSLSPFTHTIKLESDMLWTCNTDWWWNHLWQHDLVFAVNCRNYKDQVVKHYTDDARLTDGKWNGRHHVAPSAFNGKNSKYYKVSGVAPV